MRFTKMQGAGNDYIFVEMLAQTPPENLAELARRMSDRHFGVGGDGLILILPSSRADARMRMFNADGSEAEMCGNGIRCVGAFLMRQKPRRKVLRLETVSGVKILDVLSTSAQMSKGKWSFRVNMGRPILEPVPGVYCFVCVDRCSPGSQRDPDGHGGYKDS